MILAPHVLHDPTSHPAQFNMKKSNTFFESNIVMQRSTTRMLDRRWHSWKQTPLRLALLRLGYPSSWFSPFSLAWSSRHMYMHRKMRPPREVVHVFKLNYNGVIRVNWGKPVKSLCYNLRQVMRALRLFCILQPSLNLRRRFHGAKIRSLLALERRIMHQVDIVDMPTQELLLNLR